MSSLSLSLCHYVTMSMSIFVYVTVTVYVYQSVSHPLAVTSTGTNATMLSRAFGEGVASMPCCSAQWKHAFCS